MTGNFDNRAQTCSRTAAVICPSSIHTVITGIFGISLFVGLIYAGSLIRIPLQPVPITLQTMFVLLAGAILGGGRGSAAGFAYMGIGMLGAPVFAGSAAGWAVIAGPTGGYIAAFLVVPLLIGRLISRSHSLRWQAAVFSLGTLLILALGTLHLTLFYTHNLSTALMAGVVPFIPGDIMKIAAALSIYRSFTAIRNCRSRSL